MKPSTKKTAKFLSGEIVFYILVQSNLDETGNVFFIALIIYLAVIYNLLAKYQDKREV